MEFRLLGPVEAVRDGRAVPLGGSRERQLLALLLLNANQVVSADRLIAELWGGREPDGALRALWVFVSRLRAALRAAAGNVQMLHTRSPGYLLEVDEDALDVTRFEAAVSRARAAGERGEHAAAAEALRSGLGLWRGPALADLGDPSIARAEVGRLEELRRSAVERRVEADLACGRHADVVPELDGLTREHPLRERMWAARMLALYRCGRQVEALAAYGEVRRILAGELGLDPGLDLVRLESAILRHDPALEWRSAQPRFEGFDEPWRPSSPQRSTGRRAGSRRTPFVGRHSERAALRARLTDAIAGRGGVVLVGGEPGAGKTRLTEELAAEAAGRGVRARTGHCYEGEGAPYLPFVEILEQALDAAPSPTAFRTLLGEQAPEVARLLPRLRRLFDDLPAALELPPEQERRHLFNSVREVLSRAAKAAPTLLVFEDLHWADEATLLLLEHLAERVADLPVLLIGTYRDTEIGARPALARTVDNLIRRNLLHRQILPRLRTDEVAELLAAMSGRRPPEALVKAIDAQTDGNPFFVEEVYRHLAESDRLFDADGEFRAGLTGELDVPETLRLILGRRLGHLDSGTRRVLECAAVAGRMFDVAQLAAMGGAASVDLLDALDQAEDARLVLPATAEVSDARLMFAHELIRQTILSRLSRLRRQHLHLRAAEALELTAGEAAAERAAEIAEHLRRAGPGIDPARVFDWLVRAGRHAMATAGFEEARRAFEQALTLRVAAGPQRVAELWVDVALARRSLGAWDAVHVAWQQAIDGYTALGDDEALARSCSEAATDLAYANRDAEAFDLARRGLDVVGNAPTAQRARMLAWTAGAGGWFAPPAVIEPMIADAVALAETLGEPRLMGEALLNQVMITAGFGRPAEAAPIARRAFDLLAGDRWNQLLAGGWEIFVRTELGEFDALRGRCTQIAEDAGRLGYLLVELPLRWGAATADLACDGDLARFESQAREALQVGEGLNFELVMLPWLGMAKFLQGDWDAARVSMVAGRQTEWPNRVHGIASGSLFQTSAYLGDRAGALEILEAELAYLPRLGEPAGWGSWQFLGYVVEGLAVLGERERCAALYPLVRAFVDNGVVLSMHHGRLTQRVAGIAAAAGGQWQIAETHFTAALRLADELPHVIEYAETRRFLAMMLRERNAVRDADRAAVLAAEAATRYRELGMRRHVDLVAGQSAAAARPRSR